MISSDPTGYTESHYAYYSPTRCVVRSPLAGFAEYARLVAAHVLAHGTKSALYSAYLSQAKACNVANISAMHMLKLFKVTRVKDFCKVNPERDFLV